MGKERMKKLGFVLAACVSGSLIGCASGTDATDSGVELPPSAVTQIESLLAEKAARTPAQKKISSQLLYAASGRFASALAPAKDPAKQITSLSQTDARGRVLVDIKGDVSDGQIQALGGVLVGASPLHHSARAWLPLDRLEELAGNATVHAIRPALAATTD